MKLARTIHLDESDSHVFHNPARSGEWAISGGFEFSNWTEDDLVGKARQAFSNGWLGLDSFGRATFVAVCPITGDEHDRLVGTLAEHFVAYWGAPSVDAALPVARDEVGHMVDLCADLDDNTLLTVMRSLTESGVRETFRVIDPTDARIEQVARHATPEGD